MKTLVVIPARLGSSRLPEKPLLKETGKFLVEHVYEQAKKAQHVDKVVVATDSEKIVVAVESFGGIAYMTDSAHQSGTDRIAEVAEKEKADIYINVQGDEPEIAPEAIDQVAKLLKENVAADVATLAFFIDAETALNPNLVKVVVDKNNYALYFSRSIIPYNRDNAKTSKDYLGHVGMYAYRANFLKTYASLEVSFLEKMEKLEQLRVLENGFKIVVGNTEHCTQGVDTIDHYQKFVERYKHAFRYNHQG